MDYSQLISRMMNPQSARLLKQILQEVKDNNGDAKGLFYKKAEEMGVDPQTILNQIGGIK